MSSIASRLREFRAAVGLTQREVAELCGLGKRTIIYWEMGDREIKCSKLIPLVDEYDLDFNWLILGRGKMFNESLSETNTPVEYEYNAEALISPEEPELEPLEEMEEELSLTDSLPEEDVHEELPREEPVDVAQKPEQEDVLTLIQRLRRKK